MAILLGSTFRKITRAVAFAAAAMVAVTAPALAGDFAKEHGIPPEAGCAGLTDKVAILKCGTAYFKKKIAEANAGSVAEDKRRAAAVAQGAAADARGAAADARGAAADARGAAADARRSAADAQGTAADKRIVESQKTIDAAQSAKECVDGVAAEIEKAKKTWPLTPEQKTSFRSRINACGG